MTDNHTYHMDPPGRVNMNAVTAAILTVLASMLLLMTLGAALRIWTLGLSDVRSAGVGFWVWVFAAWNVSVFFGARLAVAASRSGSFRDGFIQSIAVWAGSSLAACLILVLGTGELIGFGSRAPAGPLWISFSGNAVSLVAAIWAGRIESYAEERAEERELWQSREAELSRLPRAAS